MARREAESERYEFWRDLPNLPERPTCAHKGTFGTTLIVAGSKGMAGAAGLAGAAALRAGSGLTRVLCPETIQDAVASYEREYTTIGAPCDERGRLTFDALDLIMEEARKATAVAVGPGLGRSKDLDELILRLFFDLEKPAVFDADALNALAAKKIFHLDVNGDEKIDKKELSKARQTNAPRVLTPHPGEYERLFNVPIHSCSTIRTLAARDGARRTFRYPITTPEDGGGYESCVVALKGPGTVVAKTTTCVEICDDGGETEMKLVDNLRVNATGNANLATGGSGDVLTGIIAGLIAQGLGVMAATRVGAALHGIAAELRTTAATRGAVASDIVAFLPYAFDYYELARREALDGEDDEEY